MSWKITVTPDGYIKALNVDKQTYVYLPNRLIDEFGDLTLCIDGDHRKHYCIFDLTNDPIADSIKKLVGRHGRSQSARLRENLEATRLKGFHWFMKRIISKFHS